MRWHFEKYGLYGHKRIITGFYVVFCIFTKQLVTLISAISGYKPTNENFIFEISIVAFKQVQNKGYSSNLSGTYMKMKVFFWIFQKRKKYFIIPLISFMKIELFHLWVI